MHMLAKKQGPKKGKTARVLDDTRPSPGGKRRKGNDTLDTAEFAAAVDGGIELGIIAELEGDLGGGRRVTTAGGWGCQQR